MFYTEQHTRLQHPTVSSKLSSIPVVSLVDMFGPLWRWYPNTDSDGYAKSRQRGYSVPFTDEHAILQHPKMSTYELPSIPVVSLVSMFSPLWWW